MNSNPDNISLFGAVEYCPSTLDYDHVYSNLNRMCEIEKGKIKVSNLIDFGHTFYEVKRYA